MRTLLRKRRWKRREGGQALAEFAIVVPLLALLMFGFVDVARLYQSWVTIQHAAREGVRYGITGRTDCDSGPQTRTACIETVVRDQTKGLTDPDNDVTVFLKTWDFPGYAGSGTDNSAGDQCDALEVRVEYDFTPSTPMIGNILGAVHLVARQRLINEPFGPCS